VTTRTVPSLNVAAAPSGKVRAHVWWLPVGEVVRQRGFAPGHSSQLFGQFFWYVPGRLPRCHQKPVSINQIGNRANRLGVPSGISCRRRTSHRL